MVSHQQDYETNPKCPCFFHFFLILFLEKKQNTFSASFSPSNLAGVFLPHDHSLFEANVTSVNGRGKQGKEKYQWVKGELFLIIKLKIEKIN